MALMDNLMNAASQMLGGKDGGQCKAAAAFARIGSSFCTAAA